MKCEWAKIIWENDKAYLALELPERDILAWLIRNEQKLPMEIEIKTKRPHRSIDANSYMWVLADKIAAAVGITKEEVYRHHIYDVGVYTDIAVQETCSEQFMKNFEANGVGWIAEKQDYCKLPKCDKIRCYYGSSTYDSKQMSRLIDSLIEDAKQYGIETLPPDELERLKQSW